jgi:hypothetical protein
MEYDEWLEEVDRSIQRLAPVSMDDLSDQPYRYMYIDGYEPHEAAREVLESEGYEG